MPVTPPKLVEEVPEGKHRGAPKTTITSMRSRGVVTQPEGRWRSHVTELPFLLEHDILKVTNVDNVAWEFKWDRKRYVIQPNATGYVPFPAVVIKMGDPRSVEGAMTRFNTDDGQQGVIATRHDVMTSLFAHYGIGQENIEELVEFAPKLEIRTMDGDQIVSFPAQQPDMAAWPVPQEPLPGRENSDQRRLMDRMTEENRGMRDEIAELRAMVSERLGGAPAQAAPASEAEPAGVTEPDLAAALAGASVDPGPATRI